MNDEFFEFARVLIYLIGAIGVFHLAQKAGKIKLALLGISFQFAIRSLLLFLQYGGYDYYRQLNNWTTTPSIFIAVALVYVSLYQIRKF